MPFRRSITRAAWTAPFFACFALALVPAASADAQPASWRAAWPDTDFAQRSVELSEIRDGGPPKDGIPSIDEPRFAPVAEEDELPGSEPVIGLEIAGDARAYPLRILTWHEIVNDRVGGVPVAVTYCPLCNAALVFDRQVGERVLEFGTTGKLRKSDLVMYDRQTESWWQQFQGEAIVGELTGTALELIPARLESWDSFKARHPQGRVLQPPAISPRPYGINPYVGYDGRRTPYFDVGDLPDHIAPMAYVVTVEDEAWPLERLREAGRLEHEDLVLTWRPGQNSALDTRRIAEGRDVGNVTVQRRSEGGLEDVPYEVTFAFVFHAFRPDGVWHD